MEREINLTDVYLSAFEITNGIEPKLELRNGRVIFIFKATDKFYEVMNDFNDDVAVPVTRFVSVIKTLRGRMLSLKESANGTHEKGRISHVG